MQRRSPGPANQPIPAVPVEIRRAAQERGTSGPPSALLDSIERRKREATLILSHPINVLVAFAAFAFVGAVLLGMF